MDQDEFAIIVQADLRKRFGIPFHRSHLARLEQKGEFPARIKVGDHTVAYRVSDVRAWLASRKVSASV